MQLSEIIRPVPPNLRKTLPPPGFSLITIDPAKRIALKKPPFFGADNCKYYHVASSGQSSLPPQDRNVTDDLGRTRTWRCHLTAIAGTDLRAELAFATATHGNAETAIWKVVNSTVDASVLAICADTESPVTKPTPEKFAIINKDVEERLFRELGLRARASIKPAITIPTGGVDKLQSEEFQVRLSDMGSDETLRLRLEVDILYPVSQSDREHLIGRLPDREDLVSELQGLAQSHLTSEVKLQEFCYHEETVRDELVAELKPIIPDGLSILSLRLHWLNAFPIRFPTEAEKLVECKVQPNQTRMQIRHTVLLRQVDIAKWRKARVTGYDLTAWVEERLAAVTSHILSKKTYVEIMTEFPQVKTEIEKEFSSEIATIGFSAEQLISHTQDQDLEKILEDRSIDVKTGDEEYPTADGHVRFGLRVATGVKFSIEKVKRFVVPGTDFKAEFVKALRSGTEQAIRKLTPEALYAAFYEGKGNEPPAQSGRHRSPAFYEVESSDLNAKVSADELIRRHIRHELAAFSDDSTGNTTSNIDLAAIPTAMNRIYTAIMRQLPRSLPLEVEALDHQGGETVAISTQYTMDIAAKGWSRFQKVCNSLLDDPLLMESHADDRMREAAIGNEIVAKVESLIKGNAESMLGRLPLEFFVSPNDGQMRIAEAVAFYGFSDDMDFMVRSGALPQAEASSAVARVEADFGLLMHVRSFRINLTPTQVILRKQRSEGIKHRNDVSEQTRLNRLEAIREMGPDDPRLEEYKKATEAAEQDGASATIEGTSIKTDARSLLQAAKNASRLPGARRNDPDSNTNPNPNPQEGEP